MTLPSRLRARGIPVVVGGRPPRGATVPFVDVDNVQGARSAVAASGAMLEASHKVIDNGRPFDPFTSPAPDTTLSVEDRDIGGQGIHLVRRMVDELRYHRRSDRNIVMLTKRLGGGAPADHSERDAGGRGDGDHDA